MRSDPKRTTNRWFWLEIGLLAIGLLAGLYVAFSPADSLLNWYSSDDAFYYYKVAVNITSGGGMTFDGINPTNGFHPLWMLVCLPVFMLAEIDLLLPLRVLVVVSSLLGAGTGILLFRLLRRFVSAWVAAAAAIVWTCTPAIHNVIVQQGLESTLNAFLLMLLIHLVVSRRGEGFTPGRMATVGIVAGLAILARLDNVFLVFLLGAWFALDSYHPYLRTVIIADLGLIFSAGLLGYFFKLGVGAPYIQNSESLPFWVGLGFLLYPLAFLLAGLYSPPRPGGFWKFLLKLASANLGVTVLTGAALLGFQRLGVYSALPRSVILINGALVFAGSIAWRLAVNAFHGAKAGPAADVPKGISRAFWRSGFQRALAYFVPLAVLLGGYMIWSRLSVGLWMPVSGQVKRWWGGLSFTFFGTPEKDVASLLGFNERGAWELALSPFETLKDLGAGLANPGSVFILSLVLAGGAALALLVVQRKWIVPLVDQGGLFAWLVGAYAHIFYYTTTSYIHMRTWYWVGEMLFTIVLFALLLECTRLLGRGKKAWTAAWAVLLTLCCLGSLAGLARMTVKKYPYQASAAHVYLSYTQALEASTEPGALIGMTGSGAIGYFIQDRTVVNLDGLINSPEYFHSLSSGQGEVFLSQLGLDYVYGNAIMLTETTPYQEMFARNVELVKEIGELTLYRFTPRR